MLLKSFFNYNSSAEIAIKKWSGCTFNAQLWMNIQTAQQINPVNISESPSLFWVFPTVLQMRARAVPCLLSITSSPSALGCDDFGRFFVGVEPRRCVSWAMRQWRASAGFLLSSRLVRCSRGIHWKIAKCIRGWESHPSALNPPSLVPA